MVRCATILTCVAHYQALNDEQRFKYYFSVNLTEPATRSDIWPGYLGRLVRAHPQAIAAGEPVPEREALAGRFGLLPHWAKDDKFGRRTFNARSETAATLPSFRDAWRKSQRCIIPTDAIYEPDWRSGKAVATRIARADGEPMGIAGLWSWWKSPTGQEVHSFTMLTINGDDHILMRNFHKPADEKRMVVILPEGAYEDWLTAPAEQGMRFMEAYPAKRLTASAPVIDGLF